MAAASDRPEHRVLTYDSLDVANAQETWLSSTRLLDTAGRPTDMMWNAFDDQVVLGLDSAFYGKDDRLVGKVRSWTEEDGTPWHGLLRLANYDGAGRVAGVNELESFDASQINGWYQLLDDAGYRAALAGYDASRFQVETQSDFGGVLKPFERTPLGALTEEVWDGEDVDGNPYLTDTVWSAEVIAARALVAAESSAFLNDTQSASWNDRGMMLSTSDSTMTWSADDHLVRVTRSSTESLTDEEEYVYDGLGRLVRTIRGRQTVDRVYLGDSVLREVSDCVDRVWWPSGELDGPASYSLDVVDGCFEFYDPSFTLQEIADYCSPGEPVDPAAEWLLACDEIIDPDSVEGVWLNLDLMDLTEATLWTVMMDAGQPRGHALFLGLLQDLHHDVVAVVGTDLQRLETYDYGIHGDRVVRDGEANLLCASTNAQACGSSWGNSRGYTGRFLSSLTGLYDHRARQYDPHLRVWTAPDPLGYVDSYDLWAYVDGDPVNGRDPYGEQEVSSWLEYLWTNDAVAQELTSSAGNLFDAAVNSSRAANAAASEYARGAANAAMDTAWNVVFSDAWYHYPAQASPPSIGEPTGGTAYTAGEVAGFAFAGPVGAMLSVARFGARSARAAARWARAKRAASAPAARAGGRLVRKVVESSCFIAGTIVETELGATPIEHVRIGDRVLSRDEATGEVSYQAVVDTFVRHDVPTLEVTFVGNGATERLVTTGEHPFWVVGRGWVEARELLVGDELFSSAGGWLRVGSAMWTGRTETVYNFEVAGTHSYFVGDAVVWVHNSDACLGGGVIYKHFTNGDGVKGITGVDPDTMKVGDSVVVDSAKFGEGKNDFMASVPGSGENFITDLPVDASKGDLDGIGVFGDKQEFVIEFSEENMTHSGVRQTMSRPHIHTIPKNSVINEGNIRVTRVRCGKE